MYNKRKGIPPSFHLTDKKKVCRSYHITLFKTSWYEMLAHPSDTFNMTVQKKKNPNSYATPFEWIHIVIAWSLSLLHYLKNNCYVDSSKEKILYAIFLKQNYTLIFANVNSIDTTLKCYFHLRANLLQLIRHTILYSKGKSFRIIIDTKINFSPCRAYFLDHFYLNKIQVSLLSLGP